MAIGVRLGIFQDGMSVGDLLEKLFDTDDPELDLSAQELEDRELGAALLASLRRKTLIETLQKKMSDDERRYTEQLKAQEKTEQSLRDEIARLKAQKANLEDRVESLDRRVGHEVANREAVRVNIIRLIRESHQYFAAGGKLDEKLLDANADDVMNPRFTVPFYPDQPKPEPAADPKGTAGKTGRGGRNTGRKRK